MEPHAQLDADSTAVRPEPPWVPVLPMVVGSKPALLVKDTTFGGVVPSPEGRANAGVRQGMPAPAPLDSARSGKVVGGSEAPPGGDAPERAREMAGGRGGCVVGRSPAAAQARAHSAAAAKKEVLRGATREGARRPR